MSEVSVYYVMLIEGLIPIWRRAKMGALCAVWGIPHTAQGDARALLLHDQSGRCQLE